MLLKMNVLHHPLEAFLSRLSTEGKALNLQDQKEKGQILNVPPGSPTLGKHFLELMALSYPSISKMLESLSLSKVRILSRDNGLFSLIQHDSYARLVSSPPSMGA